MDTVDLRTDRGLPEQISPVHNPRLAVGTYRHVSQRSGAEAGDEAPGAYRTEPHPYEPQHTIDIYV